MHPDLQKYLDGELPREALSPELQAQADAWDALTDAARGFPSATAPSDLARRVMAALPETPAQIGWRERLGSGVQWLLRPREVTLRPVYALPAAAALAAIFFLARALPSEQAAMPPVNHVAGTVTTPCAESAGDVVIYVRFAFQAPGARSVTLAGDFNDWEPDAMPLSDPDGDGIWTGTFALQPGVHKYMFVVDGERWETDPGAERHMDDGFGMRNALIAIAPPVRRAI